MPPDALAPVPGIPVRDLGDRVLLYEPVADVETVIAGSGVEVWRLAVSGRGLVSIVEEVRRTTGDDGAAAEAAAFVEQLIDRGLLHRG